MATLKVYPSSYTDGMSKGVLSNPTNGYADDGNLCTIVADDRNDINVLTYAGFDFSAIDAGSQINSVTVMIEISMSVTGTTDFTTIQAYKSGIAVGSAQDTGEPSSLTLVSTSNTGTWTESELESISVVYTNDRSNLTTECTISIDYVAVEVDYTPGSPVTINVPTATASATALTPTISVTSNVNISVPVATASLSGLAPTIEYDMKISVPVATASATALAPSVGVFATVNAPTATASMTAYVPRVASAIEVAYLDNLQDLYVNGEIIEGSVVELSSGGNMTVVEIIEGSVFELSATGVLTVISFTEGGN